MAETHPQEATVVVERQPGRFERLLSVAGVVIGTLYLVNPTAGILELIPDNLPVFGNLDEAAATTLVVLGLQRLGRSWKRPDSRR